MATQTRFGLLGSVALWADSQPVEVGPAKQRAVLAVLLVRANRVVAVDEIVDLVWAEEPPRTARKNIQVYIWRLRQLIGTRLESSPPGYRLSVAPDELDLLRFETLVASARAARQAGLPHQATTDYRAALELWRGAALADVTGIGRLGAAAAQLERRRLSAYEDQIDVELELDRHATVLPLLDELVTRYPLHERFAEQQILALYRTGQRAEAVEAYRRCHRTLARELGVEPGPGLQRLARTIRESGPAPDPGLRQLPPTVSTFTGRDAELALLREQLCLRQGHAIAVWVLTGRAGVGKSALAVHAAHQLAPRFPGGQLYVDLHGATAGLRPLPPIEVLQRFLRVLGIADRTVPSQVEEVSALLRSLLADRKLLMVLDNAYDAGQVRPLIPAGTDCAVLITARRSLADLDGANHLELDALPDADALTLLQRLAGGVRVACEAEAASELVHWSGGLPLAIRIAGARLMSRPSWTLASLAGRLRDERHRLRELRLGDIAIRTSFLVSYQHLLDPLASRLFRLLGAVGGSDMALPVAAALVDLPPRTVQDALDELVDARLLDETPQGRYRMHDLIRLFARERADAEEPAEQRDMAMRRLLQHYLHVIQHALSLVCPGSRLAATTGPPGFTDPGEALSWLETERPNLVAAVLQATASTDDSVVRVAVALADSMYLYFQGWGHIEDWIAVDRCAIDAAGRLADRTAEARLLHDLAVAYFYLHRMDDSAKCLHRSLQLSRAAGDDDGQARALNQLGIMSGAAGDYDQAAEYLKDSLRLRKRLGDVRAAAATQGNIGMVYRLSGRYEESVRFCSSAARLARRSAAPEIEANALGNLGEVHCLMERYESALRYLRRGLALRGMDANERNRGSMLSTLAGAYLGAGRIAPAIRHAELAVEAFRRAEFRHGEAEALRQLGRMLCQHGESGRGVEQLRLALTIFTALDSEEAAEVRAELAAFRLGD